MCLNLPEYANDWIACQPMLLPLFCEFLIVFITGIFFCLPKPTFSHIFKLMRKIPPGKLHGIDQLVSLASYPIFFLNFFLSLGRSSLSFCPHLEFPLVSFFSNEICVALFAYPLEQLSELLFLCFSRCLSVANAFAIFL